MLAPHALLRGIVDYAGLFPPAQLAMAPAVRNYAAYRAGPHAWALGRFVLPVARLAEFEAAAAPLLDGAAGPWPISALSADPAADRAAIEDFNRRLAGLAVIDALECKAARPAEIAAALAGAPAGISVFVEIPIAADPEPLVSALAGAGGRAKVRTGGVTAEAFPPPAELARFLAACARHAVPFKATAGLHHPLRAEHPLTYEPASPRGVMHGFLNVFLAAALLRAGGSQAQAAELLAETDAAALAWSPEAVAWRGWRFDAAALADLRAAAIGFGSCSFEEPIDDLHSLEVL
ncbi:MAG TPA: hypothetical protein VGE07_24505 [Herpetosiphonaceae bacterium]